MKAFVCSLVAVVILQTVAQPVSDVQVRRLAGSPSGSSGYSDGYFLQGNPATLYGPNYIAVTLNGSAAFVVRVLGSYVLLLLL